MESQSAMQDNVEQQDNRLNKSRSQRILWLLEECKLKYELKIYYRQPSGLAPPELKKIHPLGKSPVISIEADGLTKPLVLAESGVIVEYLIDHYAPHLAPKKWQAGMDGKVGGETEEWLRYSYRTADGQYAALLSVARDQLKELTDIRSKAPFLIRPISNAIVNNIDSLFLTPNFKSNWDFLEGQLATSPNDGKYLCGKYITGADILMSFPLGAAKGRAGVTKEKYPLLWAYVERLEAGDSFKRAVQKIIDIEGSYDPTL
ncbi:hypothetical protein MMC26_004164 [Xylographa opegraphella]|nr:hypothetical protein [Xylographa opegraphella]